MGKRPRRKAHVKTVDFGGYCAASSTDVADPTYSDNEVLASSSEAARHTNLGEFVVRLNPRADDFGDVQQRDVSLYDESSAALPGNMCSFTSCAQSKTDEVETEEGSLKTAIRGITRSCSTTSLGEITDDVSSARESECQTSGVSQLKLIFLDMDGPLVVWKDSKMHEWKATDTLDELPYVQHADALQRIIDAAGGPEVVKIIISSNWRTDEERYSWLVSQLAIRGIDVLGHTDVVHTHPESCADGVIARNMEIQRMLNSRVFGASGPHSTPCGSLAYTSAALPDACQITSWIAIDDLSLESPSLWRLDDVKFVSWFVSAPDDKVVGNGWTKPAPDFLPNFTTWAMDFAKSHFVKVDCQAGLAGTPEAESTAIQLLCATDW